MKSIVIRKINKQLYKITDINAIMKPITLKMESLALQDKHMSKIMAVEMKFTRKTAGKTRRDWVRNERNRDEFEQKKTLVNLVEEYKMKWKRKMGEEREGKVVFEIWVEGRFGCDRSYIT